MKYTLSLKDIRKSRGLTQAELGEKVGTAGRVYRIILQAVLAV